MVVGGKDSLYKKLEAGLSTLYKPFSTFTSDDTSWCGFNDRETGFYLGGAAIANFLGTGVLPPCNLLQEALRNSTAHVAVIMLGGNDCLRLQHTRTTILNDFIALIQTVTEQGRIPLVISEWFIDHELPMDGHPGPEDEPCQRDVNDNLHWIRGKVKQYCSDEKIAFLDLSDYLFREFSPAYSRQLINWRLVDQQMKHNWTDVYLLDGAHPGDNARRLSYSIIGPWLNTVLDLDADEVSDTTDNCPAVPNPDQTDTDGDCAGDTCDEFPYDYDTNQPDTDRDGRGDMCDNCPAVNNADQADADGDEMGDSCDNHTIHLFPHTFLRSRLISLPLFMLMKSSNFSFNHTTTVRFDSETILSPWTLPLSEDYTFVFSLITPAGGEEPSSRNITVRVDTGEAVATDKLIVINLPWILEE